MSVALVADVHVGNYQKFGGPMRSGLNDRARCVLSTLAAAIHEAQECEAFVVLGDLFDYSTPEAALVSAVQEIIVEHPNVILIPGNHDIVSSEYGNNALAPLAPVARVIEQPTIVETTTGELWMVPFQTGPVRDWLPGVLQDLHHQGSTEKIPRALCLHLGISDDATPYYLDGASGSISASKLAKQCKKYGVTHVFAGDWHRHQTWKLHGTQLMQVGTLAPKRFPPGYEHGDRGPMAVWDGVNAQAVDITGPRFLKRQWRDGQVADWPPDYKASKLFLKLRVRTDQVSAAKEWARTQALDGFELDVDRGVERAKARTASFEARKASSLDDAVQLFVQSMPIDGGCSRENVLRLVRQFLG